jgi:hypothetical protein
MVAVRQGSSLGRLSVEERLAQRKNSRIATPSTTR